MSNPRVFVTRRLPGNALPVLAARTQMDLWPEEMPPPREEMIRHARECEGLLTLVTDPVNRELLEEAPKLRVVSNMAVGYDNIDVAARTQRGGAVGNTTGVRTHATGDLTFALVV